MTVNLSGATVSGSHISVNTTTATAASLPNNANEYAALDYGAGYFTKDWKISYDLNVTAESATSSIWAVGVSDQLVAWVSASGSDNGLICAIPSLAGNATYSIQPRAKVSGTQTNGTAVSTLNNSTTYYADVMQVSSLGRYGGLFVQIYSDSGRTTLVIQSLYKMTADNSSRYFFPMQSINNSTTNTISGTTANFTVTQTAFTAGVDLTTYTTSGAALAAYANCMVVTTLASNVTQYSYKDDGAGHWAGNYTVLGVLNQSAWSSTSGGYFIGGTASVTAVAGSDTTGHAHSLYCDYLSGTTTRIRLAETVVGSQYYSSTSITHTLGTPVFIKRWRNLSVGTYGTLYAQAYSDPSFTVTVGSQISLTLHENVDYRYSYSVQSTSTINANTATFTFGGFSLLNPISGTMALTEGAMVVAGSGTVGGAISGTMAVTTNPMIVSASGGFITGTMAMTTNKMVVSAYGAVAGVINTGTMAVTTNPMIVYSYGNAPTTQKVEDFSIYARDVYGNLQTGMTVTMTAFQDIGDVQYDFVNKLFNNNSSTLSLVTTGRTGQYKGTADTTNWIGYINIHIQYTYTDSFGVTRTVHYDDCVEYINGTRVMVGTRASADNLALIPTNPVLQTDARLWMNNYKHVVNTSDGTVKLYDSYNALVYQGYAYADSAGTILYQGLPGQAIHNTSQLVYMGPVVPGSILGQDLILGQSVLGV